MRNINRRHLFLVVGLILLTGVIMGTTAHLGRAVGSSPDTKADIVAIPEGMITVKAQLVQDKVLLGSNGQATLELTLQASDGGRPWEERPPVDLVVVLDRSGSMNGRKIHDARRAVLALIGSLSPKDRLGIVTYNNTVESLSDLRPMTADFRRKLVALVEGIQPAGGTNLGRGLERGLTLFSTVPMADHQRRLILISDGLANHGVTDPHVLGRMAASGLSMDRVVNTIGVGNDFNEVLLTTLADHGGGTYTYMEDPAALAAVFDRAYRHAAATAASGIKISIPLKHGVQLIDAGGYPIASRNGMASFKPGGLRFRQTRTLYLTFQIPTDAPGEVSLEGLRLDFRSSAARISTRLTKTYTIACVANPADVMASIRKDSWAAQVVQEDFGRLKAAVADALRAGNEEQALAHIAAYKKEKTGLNLVLAAPRVSENLRREVKALEAAAREAFVGSPEAVKFKQKKAAKALQYESYQERRDKR